jgi:uncharacterized RDD family membrane protein YckC
MNTSEKPANPYAPPQAEVRDSVAQGEAELAGRGTRLGAAMLDVLIGGLFLAPALIGIDMTAVAAGSYAGAISPMRGALLGIGGLAWLAITAYLVHKNGQTIAKKIVGIKVVRSDFSQASLGRIFWLRNVVNGVIGAIPFVGNIYGLVDSLLIFGERRQCAHDKIADTVVINA